VQILIKVDTGYNCDWRNIEALQPEGFKGQTANEKETLKNSIVKNGFHDAFDVWQHEGRLLSIDGVHRKIALLELAEEGYEIPEQLPCTYVTAENETEAATIILSRNAQHSHILSAAVMTAAFMIPAATIEAVVPQKNIEAWSENDNSITEQLTAEEDDFEFEEGGIETDIVLGDLFEIGEHRLLCGDSTCSDSVTKLMNGEKADMVFTSPPYNANTSFNSGGKNSFGGGKNLGKLYENYEDNLDEDSYIEFCQSAINNCILNTQGFIFWNINYNTNSRSAFLKQLVPYLDLLNEVVCWKKNALPVPSGLTRNFEFIFVLSTKNKDIRLGKRNETNHNVWEISNSNSLDKNHRAAFPIELPSKGINLGSEVNDIILDTFCGSGSTMVAAHQLNRKCYGMELDPKYCQVIIDRMRKLDPTLIIKRNGVIYE